MRVRKLKWAKDFINQSESVVLDPSAIKGNWNTFLSRDIIHIEIGSGKGDYWIGMSAMYPTIGWIGIEKNESVAALALRKVENMQEHARFIWGDADVIETWFESEEIDVIHLNFSDPWPKNRNSKRRLTHARFIKKYYDILKKDGEIHMKSDNRKLFEYSLVQFQNEGFYLKEVSLDYRSETHDEDTITEYERKFMEQGVIYRAVWAKEETR